MEESIHWLEAGLLTLSSKLRLTLKFLVFIAFSAYLLIADISLVIVEGLGLRPPYSRTCALCISFVVVNFALPNLLGSTTTYPEHMFPMFLYSFQVELEQSRSSGVGAIGLGAFITNSGFAIAIIESLVSFAWLFKDILQWPRNSISVEFGIHCFVHLWPTRPDSDSESEYEE